MNNNFVFKHFCCFYVRKQNLRTVFQMLQFVKLTNWYFLDKKVNIYSELFIILVLIKWCEIFIGVKWTESRYKKREKGLIKLKLVWRNYENMNIKPLVSKYTLMTIITVLYTPKLRSVCHFLCCLYLNSLRK